MKTTLQKKMSVLVMWCVFFSLVSNDVYAGEETVVSFGSVAWITNSENSLTITQIPLARQKELTPIIKERIAHQACATYYSIMLDNYFVDYTLPLHDKNAYYLLCTPKPSAPKDIPVLLTCIQINNKSQLRINTESVLLTEMSRAWIIKKIAELKMIIETKLAIEKRDKKMSSERLRYQLKQLLTLESTIHASAIINPLILVYNPKTGLVNRYDLKS